MTLFHPSLNQRPYSSRNRPLSLRTWLAVALTLAITAAVPAAAQADGAQAGASNDKTQTNMANQQLDRDTVLEILSKEHVSGTPRSALEGLKVPGMVELLKDPYTVYFTKEELAGFTDYLEQNYVGIGAVVGLDDIGPYIDRVIPNSPAEAAGLQRDDYIVAVNGSPVKATSTSDVVKDILGPAGTKVSITIKRGEVNKDYSLTRRQIQLPVVTSGLFQPGVGLIRLTDFSSDAGTKFAVQLDELVKQGAKSLIIDLRDNPGGLLSSAKTIAEQFVQSGVLIHTKNRNNVDEPVALRGQKRDLPVTILVNENSASASEVITGALRDYGVAKVVGTKTFGKGSVQQLYDLPSGGALKVTVQEYLTPKMVKVNHVGLTPDITVEGDMPQLISALRIAGLGELSLKDDKHHLSINGLDVLDNMPIIREQGHVYAPTRTITSLLAGSVAWNGATRSVEIAAHNEKAGYSESARQLILKDGFSFIDLEAVHAAFPELSYTDVSGTLSLTAKPR